MFWESEDFGVSFFNSNVSSSTSSKTGGNSLFIFSDSYCSTPSSPFLECLVAKDNSFLLPLAQVGLVNVTLLLRFLLFLLFCFASIFVGSCGIIIQNVSGIP
ncbi:hypothetical protein NC651_036826 [Populus alba x Populus x berolinensis]|nr:hypothetical protein NC651_036826 [Populus alba x Populus x berolinensis]